MTEKGFREGLEVGFRRAKPTKRQIRAARLTKKDIEDPKVRLGLETAQFAKVGMQEPDFSTEQQALQQMFGGGEKVWGINQQPVTLHNDLNPSRRGDMGTADMFGFGGRGERSGLF